MRNKLTLSAAIAILSVGSLVSISAHAAGSTAHGYAAKSGRAVAIQRSHNGWTTRQATLPSGDITNFSSSSALNVGVNHPPKK